MGHKRQRPTASGQKKEAPPLSLFTPLNNSQREALSAFPTSDVLILSGPAGGGKTFCALALALSRLPLPISIIRPPIEATSRSIGHLPGDLNEKLAPYMVPLTSLLSKLTPGASPSRVPLEILSLAHSRGTTFENCTVIVDEAQNLTYREFTLLLSRLGPNAKLIFSGDPDQCDIRPTQPTFLTDFDAFIDRLYDAPGISVIEFDPSEIVRHPRLHGWLKALQRPFGSGR